MLRLTHSIYMKKISDNKYRIKGGQHTHGSFLSHLSLDALHREQERVNLRTLAFESEETLVLTSPSFVL